MESDANQPTDGPQPPWLFKHNMHKVMDDWKDRRANEGRPVARDELHGMKAFWKSKLKEAQVEYADQRYLQLYYAEGRTWMHYGKHPPASQLKAQTVDICHRQSREPGWFSTPPYPSDSTADCEAQEVQGLVCE